MQFLRHNIEWGRDALISEHQNLPLEEWSLLRHPLPDSIWHEIVEEIKANLSEIFLKFSSKEADSFLTDFQWLDGLMSRYCAQSCPSCTDPCCRAKGIFYNLNDLLFQLVFKLLPPPGQTRTQPLADCRYLSSNGCILPRISRPYVCVWYLCESHMELLGRENATDQRRFLKTLQSIRTFRLNLQVTFSNRFPNTIVVLNQLGTRSV